MDDQLIPLLRPTTIMPVAKLIDQLATIPAESGMYGWWFKTLPPQVPSAGCWQVDDWTLLHIGISPSGHNPKTTRHLRQRLNDHLSGGANRSTLRMSLGCLLSEQLNLRLAPHGASKYLTFGAGEQRLSRWLTQHTGVSWMLHAQPWELKPMILKQYVLPLNIKANDHPFVATLKHLREQARLRVVRG
ncbi:GIY-YIG nuclease family protein [Herpetosiphon gulosus]|uniref:GIY-YIG catalytic domain-containing protein n=1 Tax=Herpetosiphon gulosus TaxID=1973496 RepID=A0ABP9X489_9CHLR